MASEGSMGDSAAAAADFTFCQVGSSAEGVLESPKVIPQIGNIRITESTSSQNATTTMTDSNRGQNPAEMANSSTNLNEMAGIKKPESRKKVPFEKGFSQMDWLKVTRTHPDLAGLKGQTNRRAISLDEVKQHKSDGSVWTVLKGRVYNITPYMKFHPGGVDMLMKAAGKDCTPLFYKYHAWVNAEFLLEKCLVGILDDSI